MLSELIRIIIHELRTAQQSYKIKKFSTLAILFSPLVIIAIFGLFIILPKTRRLALWMLNENHLVELLTFAFLLAGGIRGLFLACDMRHHRESVLYFSFYAIFSLGLIWTAMEEVAWGQWILGFETPSLLKGINAQGELTMHNIAVLQGHSEFFRLAFGIGGIVGVLLSFKNIFRKISPPVILFPWFLIISVHASLDLWNDYLPIQKNIDFLMQRSSELIEMLIGISGFLFIWLNARILSTERTEPTIKTHSIEKVSDKSKSQYSSE